jgi:hypothetical protein
MFADEMFTTTDSGGRKVELCEGGKLRQVTYENAKEYAEAIANCRLNECLEAYDLIRRGISAVVPIQLLNLFSWQ